MKKSRASLCSYLESLSRFDERAEGWKRQALPFVASGGALLISSGVAMGLLAGNSLVETLGPWGVGLGAVLGIAGGALYLAGAAGDVIDRRYQGLLYLLRDESFARADGLDLRLSLRRRPNSAREEWGQLSGLLADGSRFTLKLVTRYWTETDTMQEEYTVREDDGDLRTRTRTVIVHQRDFQQDLAQLMVERDSSWEAGRLKRHLSPRAGQHVAVSEVKAERGRLEGEFVSGVARTVSGAGMATEELDHDQLLNSLSLLELFQWLRNGEERAAEQAV